MRFKVLEVESSCSIFVLEVRALSCRWAQESALMFVITYLPCWECALRHQELVDGVKALIIACWDALGFGFLLERELSLPQLCLVLLDVGGIARDGVPLPIELCLQVVVSLFQCSDLLKQDQFHLIDCDGGLKDLRKIIVAVRKFLKTGHQLLVVGRHVLHSLCWLTGFNAWQFPGPPGSFFRICLYLRWLLLTPSWRMPSSFQTSLIS